MNETQSPRDPHRRAVAGAGLTAVLACLAFVGGCSGDSSVPAVSAPDGSGDGADRVLVDVGETPGSTRQAAEAVAAQAGLVLANPEALPGDDLYSRPERGIPAAAALASIAASVGTGVALDADGSARFGAATTLEAWRTPDGDRYFAVHADNVAVTEVLRLATSRAGMNLVHGGEADGPAGDIVLNFPRIPAPMLYQILAEVLGAPIAVHGDTVSVGGATPEDAPGAGGRELPDA